MGLFQELNIYIHKMSLEIQARANLAQQGKYTDTITRNTTQAHNFICINRYYTKYSKQKEKYNYYQKEFLSWAQYPSYAAM